LRINLQEPFEVSKSDKKVNEILYLKILMKTRVKYNSKLAKNWNDEIKIGKKENRKGIEIDK